MPSVVPLRELIGYIDTLLDVGAFRDYCPNGLQVEGRPEVRRLVSGVTASLALVEAAIEKDADAVLVHHGYFWNGEDPRIIGMKRRRLKALLGADISLLAYHLPLDAHPELGNNAQLGRLLGLAIGGSFGPEEKPNIALHGELAQPTDGAGFAQHVARVLGREPLYLPGGAGTIRTVGWCSGGAQGLIAQAAALGLDAYLSGEVSEQTVHVARETGIHFFAAGHHATERYGPSALGGHLADRFGLVHEFVDIDNPA